MSWKQVLPLLALIAVGASIANAQQNVEPLPNNPAPRQAPEPDPSDFSDAAPLFAAVVGVEDSGASSTSDAAAFHASAVLDVPLKSIPLTTKNTKDSKDSEDSEDGQDSWMNTWVWVGGAFKLAGIAQPGTLSGQLGSLTSDGTYFASALNATPDKIVQSFEAAADIAVRIAKPWKINTNSFDAGTAPSKETNPTVVTASFLLNGGMITPASVSQLNPPVYVVNSSIYQEFGPPAYPTGTPPVPSTCNPKASPSTTCYVTFIPEDRSRFYRHYEAGFRLKTYGRDFSDGDGGEYRFPAIADLTFGQNEYVTGGKASGIVLHVGGWVPVPKVDYVYLFGSMDTVLTSANTNLNQQLVLVPATSSLGLTYSSPSVNEVPVPQPNRDRYVFGFGVDVYHLVSTIGKKKSGSTQELR